MAALSGVPSGLYACKTEVHRSTYFQHGVSGKECLHHGSVWSVFAHKGVMQQLTAFFFFFAHKGVMQQLLRAYELSAQMLIQLRERESVCV